jgi:hypothetical protein
MRVLLLALLFMAATGDAAAQQFVCSTVRQGDTAARLALRLTKSAENRYAPWFQILDPATSRFIPKAAYDAIRPGWKVCIVQGAAGRLTQQITIPSYPAKPETARLFDRLAAMGFPYAWMMAVAILAPLLASPVAMKYLDRRRAMLDRMSRFGAVFVREFAQPLPRQHAADQPIKARLQCAPFRARLKILLAPSKGHSYPNLADHRKNLEYDIERVLQLVADEPFVSGEPYSRGDWVVIPFQATVMTQKGAR